MKKDTSTKGTIIFVHGAWHGKWCWEENFVPAFAAQGYKTITFDLPGHDKPGKIKGINKYTLGRYVQALRQQVEQHGEENAIIIGHSMGGRVLQRYLKKYSCKKAVFLASVPHGGVLLTTLKFALKPYFYPSLFFLNLYGLVDTLEKSKHAFFSQDIPESKLHKYSSQLCSESFLAFLQMLLPICRTKHDTSIPICVVAAKQDAIFSIREQKSLAKKYKVQEENYIELDNIAHDMMLDVNHKQVSDAILNWLNKI